MSRFSIVHVPAEDSQELLCDHPDCMVRDEPVKVWKSHLVDFEEVQKEVRQHALAHLSESFDKTFSAWTEFLRGLQPPEERK